MIKLFSSANHLAFRELLKALEESFRELGHEAEAATEGFYPDKPGDINVVITAHKGWDKNFTPSSSFNILFQVEELWNRRKKGVYDKSSGWDLVLEIFKENAEIPVGTENVRFCPIGYSKQFEGVGEDDLALAWGYDCFFFGSMTRRRKLIAGDFKSRFKRTRFIEGIWGFTRDEEIRLAKINLNCKAYEEWSYTSLHNMLIQAKGKFLLIERPDGSYGPFEAGKHFVETHGEDLLATAAYWLLNPKKRIEFGVEARKDLIKNHPFTGYLEQALKGVSL